MNSLPSIISGSPFTSLVPTAMTRDDEDLTILKAKKISISTSTLLSSKRKRKNKSSNTKTQP